MTTPTSPAPHSVLAHLRSLIPHAEVTYDDARAIAERQAARLNQLLGERPSEAAIAELPRVQIVREPLPTSGLSYWNGQCWIIVLNEGDSAPRQLFTLLHEYKHIVDHGSAAWLYRGQWEAERAADYFAACALMPKPELKRVFCGGIQAIPALAAHFGVSQAAIRYRLEQIGLVDPPTFTRQRCARPISTATWQEQQFRPAPFTTRGAA